MYTVYEVFKKDEMKFPRFSHKDRFECEVYADQNKYGSNALRRKDSELIIEEE